MLTRGPYLQLLTTHSVTVAWNTDVASACSLTIRALDGPGATIAGQPWRDVFHTPANNPAGSENYYSFDVGNAHIVVLNSNERTVPGSLQYTFLDHDLASTSARWKLVFFHHTIYSSGTTHGSNLVIRANLVPLFDAHAVDMVLMGHEHHYERTLPLPANQVVAPGAGTVYVTTGGGGKNLYPFGRLSPFTAHAESVHHFVRIAVDGDSLTEALTDVDVTVMVPTTMVKCPVITLSITITSTSPTHI